MQKTYSLTGRTEYDLTNPEDIHWLHEMFVAYFCGKGSSMTRITKYINNEIKQDMIKEKKYFSEESDEKIFIDMRRSKGYTDELDELSRNDADIDLTILLTKAAEKNMRLKVLAYLQAEYWHAITNRGKVFTYKNYSIKKHEDIAD